MAGGCGPQTVSRALASSASMPVTIPWCSPMASAQTDYHEVHCLFRSRSPRCHRQHKNEHRAPGLYNGQLTLEIPIATPHSKVRQHADEQEAEGPRAGAAHQFHAWSCSDVSGPARLVLRTRGPLQLAERGRVVSHNDPSTSLAHTDRLNVENGHALEGTRRHYLGYHGPLF